MSLRTRRGGAGETGGTRVITAMTRAIGTVPRLIVVAVIVHRRTSDSPRHGAATLFERRPSVKRFGAGAAVRAVSASSPQTVGRAVRPQAFRRPRSTSDSFSGMGEVQKCKYQTKRDEEIENHIYDWRQYNRTVKKKYI